MVAINISVIVSFPPFLDFCWANTLEELPLCGFAHGRDEAQAFQHSHEPAEEQHLLRAKLSLGLGSDPGTGQASAGPGSRENTHF